MRPVHRYALWLVAAASLASGCPATPLLVNARPLGHGKNAIIVAGVAYGLSLAEKSSGVATIPTIDLMYRRGIGDRFDIGLGLNGWGKVMLDGKINLLNKPSFALSLDPGIGGNFISLGSVAGYVQFNLPLLMDLVFSPAVRMTLAPMYSGIYASAGMFVSNANARAYFHLMGGSVAFEFTLAPWFRLQPFGGVQWFKYGDITVSDGQGGTSVSGGSSLVWYTGGLAAKFVF